jgi:hypothetical protein
MPREVGTFYFFSAFRGRPRVQGGREAQTRRRRRCPGRPRRIGPCLPCRQGTLSKLPDTTGNQGNQGRFPILGLPTLLAAKTRPAKASNRGKWGPSAFSPPFGAGRGGARRPPSPNAPPSAVPGPPTEDRAARAMPPRYSLDIPDTTEKVQRLNIAANASQFGL